MQNSQAYATDENLNCGRAFIQLTGGEVTAVLFNKADRVLGFYPMVKTDSEIREMLDEVVLQYWLSDYVDNLNKSEQDFEDEAVRVELYTYYFHHIGGGIHAGVWTRRVDWIRDANSTLGSFVFAYSRERTVKP